MPKKRAESHSTHSHAPSNKYEVEREIIKNLVELQKVHTNLAEKFDKLSNEISHLLTLFEITARTFTKNAPIGEEKDREFLEKIDRLLDQNKVLAKGITIMEERMREKMYSNQIQQREEPTQLPPPNRVPPKF